MLKRILTKFTSEQIKLAFAEASCQSYACQKLGLSINSSTCKKLIEHLGIDTSHFDSRKWQRKYPPIDKSCPVCGTNFRTKLGHPKEKTTCSRLCANSFFATCRNTVTANKKRRATLQAKWLMNKQLMLFYERACNDCKCLYSEPYKTKNENSNRCHICRPAFRAVNRANSLCGARKGGLASARKQSAQRRSRSEIQLAEFCAAHFEHVTTNDALFNGWDADILIHDVKLAVLWNGPWHYRKITAKHSVKQVQARDAIKLIEIAKAGWTAYVIKDNVGNVDMKRIQDEFSTILVMTSGMERVS